MTTEIDYASDIFRGEETHLFVVLQGRINYNKNFSVAVTFLREEQKCILWALLSSKKVEVIRANYPVNPHPWGSGEIDPTRSTILFREENSSLVFLAIPREFLQWRGYATESYDQKDMMRNLGVTLACIMDESSRETWRFGSGRIVDGTMTNVFINTREYVGHEGPKCPFQLLRNFENSSEFSEIKNRIWRYDYRGNTESDLY